MSLEGEQAPDFTLRNTAGGEMTLSDRLESGPAVVLINRGYWCSFCAEQLATFDRVAEDLRFNESVDIIPVVTSRLDRVVEMRDRFDYSFQLTADSEGEVAERYSGTEETSHGLTGIAGTYVIDEDGTVRYEQVAENPADRTHGNWVRYFLRNDYENPFA
jgi:peroxiredoxin